MASTNRTRTERTARQYYEGDHWPSWIGPYPDMDEERLKDIQRIFLSQNMIAECVDRTVRCLIGQPPQFVLRPISDAEPNEELIKQHTELLQSWIDRINERASSAERENENRLPLTEAVTDLLLDGRAHLRLWRPRRFETADDPIDRLHMHAAQSGEVDLDYDEEDGFLNKIEYSSDSDTEIQRMADNGQLEIEFQGETRLVDTGGRWMIATMKDASIVPKTIKQLQDAVNFTLTMMLREQEQNGFLERIFLNVYPPGHFETQANGSEKYIPDAITRGPGIERFYNPPLDDDGSRVQGTVHEHKPVGPDHFVAVLAELRLAIYNQFGQGHLIATGDGSINGISRVQMRADFESTLSQIARVIAPAIGAIYTMALKELEVEGYTVKVTLKTTTGKLMPDERQAIRDEYSQNLLDQQSAIEALGRTDDAAAMIERINKERQSSAAAILPPVPEDGPPGGGDNPDDPGDDE